MLIRLKPLFFKKVWGGDKLKNIYDGAALANIGECWGLSAHRSATNLIVSSPYAGMTFRTLYQQERELFGNYPSAEFPILMKLIDAADDLSIQVHPQENYAQKHENQHGKDECWYIVDASLDAKIIIGHNAADKQKFLEMSSQKAYAKLLRVHSIKQGDFFYIPAGTIHAICKDTLVFEVSQASDITYRIYDYDRLEDGKMRPLHLDKAIDVITYGQHELIRSHKSDFFRYKIVENQELTGHTADRFGDYLHVLEGSGLIAGETLKQGDFLMVSSLSEYPIAGKIRYAIVNLV